METFEEELQLRSLEMLVHKEMENPDFSSAQECSNDFSPSQHSTSVFIEGMGVHKMP